MRDQDHYLRDALDSGTLKEKAIRGAGISVFSKAGSYVIQLVGTMILARILTPNDFGLVSMVTAFSLLLQNFGVNGITEAIIQMEDANHKKVSNLFWVQLSISSVIGLLFAAMSPLLSLFYKEPRLTGIGIVVGLCIVLPSFSTPHIALLQRKMEFPRVAAIDIFSNFLGNIVAVAIALMGMGYWGLVARRTSPLLFRWWGSWVSFRWLPGRPSRDPSLLQDLRYAWNTYLNFTIRYFSRNLDKILVGKRLGASSLGQYSNAYHLFVMPLNQISTPLANVALATLSRIADDREKYVNYYLKAIGALAFVGMGISVILTAAGHDLIMLLLGDKWDQAGRVFQAFAPAVGLFIILETNSWLHLSQGRPDRWLKWNVFSLAVTVLFLWVGLFFGVRGVAAGFSLSIFVLLVPTLSFAGKPIGITTGMIFSSIYRFILAGIIASGVGMYTDIYWIADNPWQRMLKMMIVSLVSGSMYVGITLLLYGGAEPVRGLLNMVDILLKRKSAKSGKNDQGVRN